MMQQHRKFLPQKVKTKRGKLNRIFRFIRVIKKEEGNVYRRCAIVQIFTTAFIKIALNNKTLFFLRVFEAGKNLYVAIN